VLADRRPLPARFLVLGSASPALLRQASESLAGRISLHELSGFSIAEVGAGKLGRLWLRGAFPRSFTSRSDATSYEWRQEFVRTFLERDLPQLGVLVPAPTLGRFWAMLANAHGNVWNGSEFGRAFGVAHTTVGRYLDLLSAAFVVRQLPPWSENLAKKPALPSLPIPPVPVRAAKEIAYSFQSMPRTSSGWGAPSAIR